MKRFNSKINGHLDIFATQVEEEMDGEKTVWNEILIHGDSEGLKSLARLLNELADVNQDDIVDLPFGAREHMHLRPKWELSSSSDEVILGRLDAKGSGLFYDRYVPKEDSDI